MRVADASGICAGEFGGGGAFVYPRVMADLATKIRLLRQSLGENQTEFARRFGVTQGSVSRWEQGSMPDAGPLAMLADLAGVDVRSFIGADFTITTQRRPQLYVRGAVAAGVWREAVEWPEDDWLPYSGGSHFEAPLDRRFGLVVEGESMNEVYPPGTILDCVSTIGSGLFPTSGQRVVVVRTRVDGEMEATVKEYVVREGVEWLVPRSHNPAFQAPIELGSRDDGIVETTIMALVRGAYLPE